MNDDPADTILDDFRYGTVAESDCRSATSHGLDHVQTEWFRPVHRSKRSESVSKKVRLRVVPDLPDELDVRPIQQWSNDSFEVVIVGCVHLGRNLKQHSRSRRNFDCAVRPLLARHAADKCQVLTRTLVKREQVYGQTVVDIADPIGAR